MSTDELITVRQAIELTGKSKGIICRAIRENKLPIARKFRPILLHASDVLEWAKPEPPLISADDLQRLYIDERKSVHQIARELGKSSMVVHRLLVKYGIPRRTISESQVRTNRRAGLSEEVLVRWKQNASNSRKGKPLNVSAEDRKRRSAHITLLNKQPWSDQQRDKQSQARAGEKCWRWKGGSDHYRGPNGQQQRRAARKRDNYTCQNCGATEAKLGQELDVHHIIPYSEFSDYREANRLSNLISYCRQCHPKVERAIKVKNSP